MTRTSFLRPLLLGAALLSSLAACGGEDSGPLGPVVRAVASVAVEPTATDIIVGQTVTLVATPLDANGDPLRDRPVTYSSGDARLATVNAVGVVQTLAAGEVEITVASEAVATRVRLRIAPVPAASIQVAAVGTTLVEGESALLEAVVLDAGDRPLPGRVVTWRSEQPAIATVDAEGLVTAHREGQAMIVASHGALSAAVTFTVRADWIADILYEAPEGNYNHPFLFGFDPRQSPVTPTKVLQFAGARQVAPSPDGTRFAYTCDVGICVADRDGTDVKALTQGDLGYEDSPAWSPDGQRIVFRRWRQGGSAEQVEQTDLWVMDADGTDQVNITDDATSQGDPAWSPVRGDGGTRIAYRQLTMVDGHVTNRLYTMRPDGTDRRPETPAGQNSSEPSWTPDGTRLVFVQDGGEVTSDIWILTVGQGDARALMPQPISGDQRGPSVSPDGRYVVFTSTHEEVAGVGYKRQLFTVRIDGTGLTRRTSDAADKENPAWRVRP